MGSDGARRAISICSTHPRKISRARRPATGKMSTSFVYTRAERQPAASHEWRSAGFFHPQTSPLAAGSCNNRRADTPPVSACGDPLRPPRSSPWRGGFSISETDRRPHIVAGHDAFSERFGARYARPDQHRRHSSAAQCAILAMPEITIRTRIHNVPTLCPHRRVTATLNGRIRAVVDCYTTCRNPRPPASLRHNRYRGGRA